MRSTSGATTLILILTASAAGCRIAGSWHTVSVDPPDEEFPIARLALDEHSNFTATGPIDRQVRTRIGRYRMAWRTLMLMPSDGPVETYRTGMQLGGRLKLTTDVPRQSGKVTAMLERDS